MFSKCRRDRGRSRKQVPKSKAVVDTDSEAEAADAQSETHSDATTRAPVPVTDKPVATEGERSTDEVDQAKCKADEGPEKAELVDHASIVSVDVT